MPWMNRKPRPRSMRRPVWRRRRSPAVLAFAAMVARHVRPRHRSGGPAPPLGAHPGLPVGRDRRRAARPSLTLPHPLRHRDRCGRISRLFLRYQRPVQALPLRAGHGRRRCGLRRNGDPHRLRSRADRACLDSGPARAHAADHRAGFPGGEGRHCQGHPGRGTCCASRR